MNVNLKQVSVNDSLLQNKKGFRRSPFYFRLYVIVIEEEVTKPDLFYEAHHLNNSDRWYQTDQELVVLHLLLY